MIEHGVDIDEEDDFGKMALFYACGYR